MKDPCSNIFINTTRGFCQIIEPKQKSRQEKPFLKGLVANDMGNMRKIYYLIFTTNLKLESKQINKQFTARMS